LPYLLQHGVKEDPRDIPVQQPLAIFTERRSVPHRVVHLKAHEPAEQQIVVQLFHQLPFAADTDVAGFFKLSAWLSLDQPDTDFAVGVYEIKPDGSSVALTDDLMRARYRKSFREAELVKPGSIERYDFDHFTFTARRIAKGSRLRLVIAPVNSMYSQKNYNSGGVVANESGKDARKVTVKVYHDATHPSALYVPLAAASSVPAK